jgi:hypothetical protein
MFSDISLKGALLSVFLAAGAVAGPIEKRAACSQYTIISTRGTGELQGPSSGFRTMNSQTLAQVPGGTVYNTVYLADASQNSALGTSDVRSPCLLLLSFNELTSPFSDRQQGHHFPRHQPQHVLHPPRLLPRRRRHRKRHAPPHRRRHERRQGCLPHRRP